MNGVAEISWKRNRYLTKVAFNLPYTGNYGLTNYVELRELFLWGGPLLNNQILDFAACDSFLNQLYSSDDVNTFGK